MAVGVGVGASDCLSLTLKAGAVEGAAGGEGRAVLWVTRKKSQQADAMCNNGAG